MKDAPEIFQDLLQDTQKTIKLLESANNIVQGSVLKAESSGKDYGYQGNSVRQRAVDDLTKAYAKYADMKNSNLTDSEFNLAYADVMILSKSAEAFLSSLSAYEMESKLSKTVSDKEKSIAKEKDAQNKLLAAADSEVKKEILHEKLNDLEEKVSDLSAGLDQAGKYQALGSERLDQIFDMSRKSDLTELDFTMLDVLTQNARLNFEAASAVLKVAEADGVMKAVGRVDGASFESAEYDKSVQKAEAYAQKGKSIVQKAIDTLEGANGRLIATQDVKLALNQLLVGQKVLSLGQAYGERALMIAEYEKSEFEEKSEGTNTDSYIDSRTREEVITVAANKNISEESLAQAARVLNDMQRAIQSNGEYLAKAEASVTAMMGAFNQDPIHFDANDAAWKNFDYNLQLAGLTKARFSLAAAEFNAIDFDGNFADFQKEFGNEKEIDLGGTKKSPTEVMETYAKLKGFAEARIKEIDALLYSGRPLTEKEIQNLGRFIEQVTKTMSSLAIMNQAMGSLAQAKALEMSRNQMSQNMALIDLKQVDAKYAGLEAEMRREGNTKYGYWLQGRGVSVWVVEEDKIKVKMAELGAVQTLEKSYVRSLEGVVAEFNGLDEKLDLAEKMLGDSLSLIEEHADDLMISLDKLSAMTESEYKNFSDRMDQVVQAGNVLIKAASEQLQQVSYALSKTSETVQGYMARFVDDGSKDVKSLRTQVLSGDLSTKDLITTLKYTNLFIRDYKASVAEYYKDGNLGQMEDMAADYLTAAVEAIYGVSLNDVMSVSLDLGGDLSLRLGVAEAMLDVASISRVVMQSEYSNFSNRMDLGQKKIDVQRMQEELAQKERDYQKSKAEDLRQTIGNLRVSIAARGPLIAEMEDKLVKARDFTNQAFQLLSKGDFGTIEFASALGKAKFYQGEFRVAALKYEAINAHDNWNKLREQMALERIELLSWGTAAKELIFDKIESKKREIDRLQKRMDELDQIEMSILWEIKRIGNEVVRFGDKIGGMTFASLLSEMSVLDHELNAASEFIGRRLQSADLIARSTLQIYNYGTGDFFLSYLSTIPVVGNFFYVGLDANGEIAKLDAKVDRLIQVLRNKPESVRDLKMALISLEQTVNRVDMALGYFQQVKSITMESLGKALLVGDVIAIVGAFFTCGATTVAWAALKAGFSTTARTIGVRTAMHLAAKKAFIEVMERAALRQGRSLAVNETIRNATARAVQKALTMDASFLARAEAKFGINLFTKALKNLDNSSLGTFVKRSFAIRSAEKKLASDLTRLGVKSFGKSGKNMVGSFAFRMMANSMAKQLLRQELLAHQISSLALWASRASMLILAPVMSLIELSKMCALGTANRNLKFIYKRYLVNIMKINGFKPLIIRGVSMGVESSIRIARLNIESQLTLGFINDFVLAPMGTSLEKSLGSYFGRQFADTHLFDENGRFQFTRIAEGAVGSISLGVVFPFLSPLLNPLIGKIPVFGRVMTALDKAVMDQLPQMLRFFADEHILEFIVGEMLEKAAGLTQGSADFWAEFLSEGSETAAPVSFGEESNASTGKMIRDALGVDMSMNGNEVLRRIEERVEAIEVFTSDSSLSEWAMNLSSFDNAQSHSQFIDSIVSTIVALGHSSYEEALNRVVTAIQKAQAGNVNAIKSALSEISNEIKIKNEPVLYAYDLRSSGKMLANLNNHLQKGVVDITRSDAQTNNLMSAAEIERQMRNLNGAVEFLEETIDIGSFMPPINYIKLFTPGNDSLKERLGVQSLSQTWIDFTQSGIPLVNVHLVMEVSTRLLQKYGESVSADILQNMNDFEKLGPDKKQNFINQIENMKDAWSNLNDFASSLSEYADDDLTDGDSAYATAFRASVKAIVDAISKAKADTAVIKYLQSQSLSDASVSKSDVSSQGAKAEIDSEDILKGAEQERLDSIDSAQFEEIMTKGLPEFQAKIQAAQGLLRGNPLTEDEADMLKQSIRLIEGENSRDFFAGRKGKNPFEIVMPVQIPSDLEASRLHQLALMINEMSADIANARGWITEKDGRKTGGLRLGQMKAFVDFLAHPTQASEILTGAGKTDILIHLSAIAGLMLGKKRSVIVLSDIGKLNEAFNQRTLEFYGKLGMGDKVNSLANIVGRDTLNSNIEGRDSVSLEGESASSGLSTLSNSSIIFTEVKELGFLPRGAETDTTGNKDKLLETLTDGVHFVQDEIHTLMGENFLQSLGDALKVGKQAIQAIHFARRFMIENAEDLLKLSFYKEVMKESSDGKTAEDILQEVNAYLASPKKLNDYSEYRKNKVRVNSKGEITFVDLSALVISQRVVDGKTHAISNIFDSAVRQLFVKSLRNLKSFENVSLEDLENQNFRSPELNSYRAVLSSWAQFTTEAEGSNWARHEELLISRDSLRDMPSDNINIRMLRERLREKLGQKQVLGMDEFRNMIQELNESIEEMNKKLIDLQISPVTEEHARQAIILSSGKFETRFRVVPASGGVAEPSRKFSNEFDAGVKEIFGLAFFGLDGDLENVELNPESLQSNYGEILARVLSSGGAVSGMTGTLGLVEPFLKGLGINANRAASVDALTKFLGDFRNMSAEIQSLVSQLLRRGISDLENEKDPFKSKALLKDGQIGAAKDLYKAMEKIGTGLTGQNPVIRNQVIVQHGQTFHTSDVRKALFDRIGLNDTGVSGVQRVIVHEGLQWFEYTVKGGEVLESSKREVNFEKDVKHGLKTSEGTIILLHSGDVFGLDLKVDEKTEFVDLLDTKTLLTTSLQGFGRVRGYEKDGETYFNDRQVVLIGETARDVFGESAEGRANQLMKMLIQNEMAKVKENTLNEINTTRRQVVIKILDQMKERAATQAMKDAIDRVRIEYWSETGANTDITGKVDRVEDHLNSGLAQTQEYLRKLMMPTRRDSRTDKEVSNPFYEMVLTDAGMMETFKDLIGEGELKMSFLPEGETAQSLKNGGMYAAKSLKEWTEGVSQVIHLSDLPELSTSGSLEISEAVRRTQVQETSETVSASLQESTNVSESREASQETEIEGQSEIERQPEAESNDSITFEHEILPVQRPGLSSDLGVVSSARNLDEVRPSVFMDEAFQKLSNARLSDEESISIIDGLKQMVMTHAQDDALLNDVSQMLEDTLFSDSRKNLISSPVSSEAVTLAALIGQLRNVEEIDDGSPSSPVQAVSSNSEVQTLRPSFAQARQDIALLQPASALKSIGLPYADSTSFNEMELGSFADRGDVSMEKQDLGDGRTAKVIAVPAVEMKGLAAFHFVQDGSIYIVINRDRELEIQQEALFHEAREAYWIGQIQRGLKQFSMVPDIGNVETVARAAHILASAEQAMRFGFQGKSGVTAYHYSEIQRLAEKHPSTLQEILSEDRTAHHALLNEAGLESYLQSNYEAMWLNEAKIKLAEAGFQIQQTLPVQVGARAGAQSEEEVWAGLSEKFSAAELGGSITAETILKELKALDQQGTVSKMSMLERLRSLRKHLVKRLLKQVAAESIAVEASPESQLQQEALLVVLDLKALENDFSLKEGLVLALKANPNLIVALASHNEQEKEDLDRLMRREFSEATLANSHVQTVHIPSKNEAAAEIQKLQNLALEMLGLQKESNRLLTVVVADSQYSEIYQDIGVVLRGILGTAKSAQLNPAVKADLEKMGIEGKDVEILEEVQFLLEHTHQRGIIRNRTLRKM